MFLNAKNTEFWTPNVKIMGFCIPKIDDSNGYLSLDTADARPGHMGILSTPVGHLNSSSLGCLKFSLDIKSATLDVMYAQYPGSLWPRPICSVPDEEETAGWRIVEMDLTSLELGEYEVSNLLFQATVWMGEDSHVWLDTIVLYPGECPPGRNCITLNDREPLGGGPFDIQGRAI